MPLLRISSNAKLSTYHVGQIQRLGSILGYTNPASIWIENCDTLSQPDVFVVMVISGSDDQDHPQFETFCEAIAEYLTKKLGKSTEVLTSSEPIHSVCWHPTKEGARKYGPADAG